MKTQRDKILLLILVATLFVVGNYFGYRWLAKKEADLKLIEANLKADEAEGKVALLQANTWAQRKEWITAHQPTMGDEGETKSDVLNHVLKGARDNKLEVLDQNLNDVQRGAAGTRVNVTVRVKGSTENLVKWLADLENPEEFYAVSTFSLKADQDQKSMVCALKIARYFKEK